MLVNALEFVAIIMYEVDLVRLCVYVHCVYTGTTHVYTINLHVYSGASAKHHKRNGISRVYKRAGFVDTVFVFVFHEAPPYLTFPYNQNGIGQTK